MAEAKADLKTSCIFFWGFPWWWWVVAIVAVLFICFCLFR